MSETELYYKYAEECRKLAATMKNPKHKKQLEEVADAWTLIANDTSKRPAFKLRHTNGGRQRQEAVRCGRDV